MPTHVLSEAEVKGMLMAAMAYNLKKYLKFTKDSAKTVAQSAEKHLLDLFAQTRLILSPYPGLKF